VPPDIAALGGDISVPTPDGLATLKLPHGTPNGKVFRLRGKGMPSLNGGGTGDLHVRISIEVPTRLSGSQKRLLQSFADSCNADNYPDAAQMQKRTEAFMARRDALKSHH
jgi:molecular chaperone DnaJ